MYKSICLILLLFATNFCQEKKINFLSLWEKENTDILCIITQYDSSGYNIRELSFYKDSLGGENIAMFKTIDYPFALMPLGDTPNNFLTLWTTGSSYRIIIFSYSNDHIEIVLDERTKRFPELFFETKEKYNLSLLILKSGEKETPQSTLFRWDGTVYQKINNVIWSNRFYGIK